MEVGNTTLYALVLLIINGGALWIREVRKGKITNGNGKHLEEIKETIDKFDGKLTTIDGKVGETNIQIGKIKTVVNSQKTQCAATVKRFDQTIGDQNKELISLAKEQGRRR